jgi:hypothetical protein
MSVVSPGSRPGTKTGIPSRRQMPSKSAPRLSAVRVKRSFFFMTKDPSAQIFMRYSNRKRKGCPLYRPGEKGKPYKIW